MDIKLLYLDGCPNWQQARDRLAGALAATGNAGTPIVLQTVETLEDAQREAFPGSPTIRIDGVDPFASTNAASLACRIYRTGTGTDGAPALTDLIAAIRNAEQQQ